MGMKSILLCSLSALFAGNASGQILRFNGVPPGANGFLDLDQPPAPPGPIASNAPAITSTGLASIEIFGNWSTGPSQVDPLGNIIGQGLVVQNGTLAVASAGDVIDEAIAPAGFRIRTQVPVYELGLLLVNELHVPYRVELLLGGTSIGSQEFSFGHPLSPIFPTFPQYWRGPSVYDEVRITLRANDLAVGIDQIAWRSVGPTLGTTTCSPAVPNSTGNSAELGASGTGQVGDLMLLEATSLPSNSFGFFLTSMTPDTIPQPAGSQGILCVGGAIGRFVGPGQLRNSGSAGEFTLLVDTTLLPTPTGFVAASSGERWYFTAWFRDFAPAGSTSNFTDALAIDFL